MSNLKFHKVLLLLFNVLLGALFLFSAYAKLPTLEKLGWTIVETTFFNWTIAEWIARLLIGIEFALGFLFLFQLANKRIYFFAIGLLLLFCIYLFLLIPVYGDGNCGCFGDMLEMTPKAAILKNVFLILILIGGIYLQHNFTFAYKKLIQLLLILISILFPFFYFPPESIYIYDEEKFTPTPVPLSILYQSKNNKAPITELRKGKHIIALMSLHCKFCKKAATRMAIMKKKYPNIPFHIVFNGDSADLTPFFKETKAQNINYSFFNGSKEFIKLNNGIVSLPTIKWLEDTTEIRQSNYLNLDEKDILKWLKQSP